MDKEREKPEITRRPEKIREMPGKEPMDVPEINPTEVPDEPQQRPEENNPQAR